MPGSSRWGSRPMSASAVTCCSQRPFSLECIPLAAVPLAGVVGRRIALPVAGMMFRLRGHYFAIGTWVVAEVFRLVASQISPLGGGSGISLPAAIVTSMAPNRQMRELEMYWLALAFVVVVLGASRSLLRSRYRLALTAIRDNELAAARMASMSGASSSRSTSPQHSQPP